jgi:TRAP-type C4-dicarboxylate transport system substrate-binding protein
LADQNTSGCHTARAIDEFCANVYEATEGRVKIDAYHDAVLGSAGDALSLLESGAADLVWTSGGIFNGQFPYSDIMSLPMLGLPNARIGTEVMWDLLDRFPEAFAPEYANYRALIHHVMPPLVIGTKKSVQSVSDLAGLNLRASAGNPTAMVNLWGAAPVAIATPDLYTSLQKGVVDGYVFDGAGINTWGLAELTQCTVDAGLGFVPCMILMSPKAWDSVPAVDQQIMTEVGGRQGSLKFVDWLQDEADELFASYEESGAEYYFYQPGDPFYEELKAPLVAYVDEWAASMTTDTVDARAMVDYILNYK